MKSRYIVSFLAILTLLTVYFIFDNVFSIWEQASYMRFRPVTVGLPAAQIVRDVRVGDVMVDFYTGPAGSARRPLLLVVPGGFLQGGNKKNYAYLGGLGVRQGFIVAVVQLPHYPGIFSHYFYSHDTLRTLALPAQAEGFARFVRALPDYAERFGFVAENLHAMAHASGALLLAAVELTRFRSLTLVSPFLSLREDILKMPEIQMRAIDGYISDDDAARFSPADWLPGTKMPVLVLCSERDLPFIREACQRLPLERSGAPAIGRVVAEKPSHYELVFHLGSKIEEATGPLKKFWFNNSRL